MVSTTKNDNEDGRKATGSAKRRTAAPKRAATSNHKAGGSTKRKSRQSFADNLPSVPTWVTVTASVVSAGLVAGYVAFQKYRENQDDDGFEAADYDDEDIGSSDFSGDKVDAWSGNNGEFADAPISGSYAPTAS